MILLVRFTAFVFRQSGSSREREKTLIADQKKKKKNCLLFFYADKYYQKSIGQYLYEDKNYVLSGEWMK